MINKTEAAVIILSAIILAFSITLVKNITNFLFIFITILIILAVNITAKKITASALDSSIELRFWEIQRYGFKPHEYFKRPIPVGLIFPLILGFITSGYFAWMASTVFEVKAKVHRAARRFGLYTFSEMTENHIGKIAASGVITTLIFAIIGYLLGFSEFARLSIYFAFFNMIPLSDLDGNKIFFGSIVLWSFLAVVTLIALGYAFLLI